MKGAHPAEESCALPRGWRAEVSALRVPGLDAERHRCRICASETRQ